MGRARRYLAVMVVGGAIAIGIPAVASESTKPIRLPFQSVRETTIVVVSRGDHLWKISDQHLSHVLGREATNEEVSPYWRLVTDLNRGNLRSGNPDLIYPGELVELPPIP